MIMVLVELTLKAEGFDQRDVILSVLPDTVAYEGCLGLEAFSNKEASKLIFVKKWENKASYDEMYSLADGREWGDTPKTSGQRRTQREFLQSRIFLIRKK